MSELKFLEMFIKMHEANASVIKFKVREKKILERINQIENEFHLMENEILGIEEKLKKMAREQFNYEKDVKEFDEKISQNQKALLNLTTQREVEAKEKEIEHYSGLKNDTEDKILQLMEDSEAGLKEQKERTKFHRERYNLFKKELSELEEKKRVVEGEIGSAENGLKELLIKLDTHPNELRDYREKEEKYKENAVVKVFRDSCEGCHQMLSPQILQVVHKGVSLVTCPVCGRYLFE